MRKLRTKQYVTIVLVVLFVITGTRFFQVRFLGENLNYAKSLDETAVTVEGHELTLRELAYYVAYEEQVVEEQAKVYNPNQTSKYWNLHIDGKFVRLAAKDSVIEEAIHDEIFYEMATEEEVVLTEEDEAAIDNTTYDFWSDLSDYDGQKRLGVSKEDIRKSIEKKALADKYEEIYAELKGQKVSDYTIDSYSYQELLKQYDYTINKKVWSRVRFGDVTLDH